MQLRRQSVAELTDEATYDLAWLPHVFIPRAAFEEACRRVYAALLPDRWVVVPLAASTVNHDFEAAVFAHTAHLVGGGPMDPSEAVAVLTTAGYVGVTAEVLQGPSAASRATPLKPQAWRRQSGHRRAAALWSRGRRKSAGIPEMPIGRCD